MVKHVLDGYHATIFAYGQTGSGKTFTMEGYKYMQNERGVPIPEIEINENNGIIPRAIDDLFDQIRNMSEPYKKKYDIYVSYLQIYQEKIYDLLNPAQSKQINGPGLKMRWNKLDIFTVENLYTFECKTPEEVLALFNYGIKNKVVASHKLNNASSRSHTIFTICVESFDVKNPENLITSKLQLVDLAGSERHGLTGSVDKMAKESVDINKSLFTLRKVISSLTEAKETKPYVPYRDSKLTCLLRQSLGGNSYCLMIACLNPGDFFFEENVSTLNYASKASYISNTPTRNDDPKTKIIMQLKTQVRLLTIELTKANQQIQFLTSLSEQHQRRAEPPPNQEHSNQSTPTNKQHPMGGPDKTHFPPLNKTTTALGHHGEGTKSPQLHQQREEMSQTTMKDDKRNLFSSFGTFSRDINLMQLTQDAQMDAAATAGKGGSAGGLSSHSDRLLHSVNMVKEILQSNLALREHITQISQQSDGQKSELCQMQMENADLRERLQIMENVTGKDSKVLANAHNPAFEMTETDWSLLLQKEHSKEAFMKHKNEIANEIFNLRKDKKILEKRVQQLEMNTIQNSRHAITQMNRERTTQMNFSYQDPTPKKQFRATMEEQPEDHEPVRSVLNDLDPYQRAQQQQNLLHQMSNSASLHDQAGIAPLRRRRAENRNTLTKKTKLNYEQRLVKKFHSTKPRLNSKSPGVVSGASQRRFELSRSIKEASPEYVTGPLPPEFPNLYQNYEGSVPQQLNRTADLESPGKGYYYFPPAMTN